KEKKADVESKSIIQVPDVRLSYLIRAVGEESSAYNSVMRISSLCENGSVVEQPTTKLPTLFIIPGLEGISSMMEPLSKNLDMQVLCLQYDMVGTSTTIEEMAASHYTLIEQRLSADQEFSIVGYSFGGLIAIEVLKLMEKNNRSGKLWLIDSAPQFLKMTTEFLIRGDNSPDQEIQVQLILRFLDLVWPHNKIDFINELYQVNTWEERLNYFFDEVPVDVVHNQNYQKQLLNSAYIKLKAILSYDGKPNGSLKTRALLIRPTEHVIPISEDYGLSEYFESAVTVHFVEGNHYSILENRKVAELISQSSSPKVL
ncbi:fatty acid synthase, partial [Aphis craccivora]